MKHKDAFSCSSVISRISFHFVRAKERKDKLNLAYPSSIYTSALCLCVHTFTELQTVKVLKF